MTDVVLDTKEMVEVDGESRSVLTARLEAAANEINRLRVIILNSGHQPANTFTQLQYRNFQTFKEKGWVDDRRVLEDLMLITTELAEAAEEYRLGKKVNETYFDGEKPCGIPSEMADIIIRVLNFCSMNDIDIEQALADKMKYNDTRQFRHGNKKL